MKLISACLLGVKCQWNNKDSKNEKAIQLFRKEILIPVCPEQMGGLPTPQAFQEIQDGSGEDVLIKKTKVINEEGKDVTEQFIKGAEETLKMVHLYGVQEFIGKSHSPSCGCGKIYDGTFSGRLRDGDGVTSALLKKMESRS